MSFETHYENVPFFCFACGRLGHSKKECPDDDEETDEEENTKVQKFGDWLRRLPYKKGIERELTVPVGQRLIRALHFSRPQSEKVRLHQA